MRDIENEPRRFNPSLALFIAINAALIVPSLAAWILRAIAFAEGCTPGPKLCHGMPLGLFLRDALAVAWAIPADTLLLVTVAVAATIAGLFAKRPLTSAACLLIMPVASLVLPMVAVVSARYDGCTVDESGVGDCMLWGTNMGMSFHTAAQVPQLIFDFFPYTAALALMLGLLGWFFAQPRPKRSHAHAMARMRRMDR